MRSRKQVRGLGSPRRGFTIVELMVVIAIIVIAAGFMAPSITDFMKMRQLEAVRGLFGSTFNQARLRAVNQRAKVSLAFFRDGVRVYDLTTRNFVDETFNPTGSPLSGKEVWYELGFLGGKSSWSLPRYSEWESNHPPRQPRSGGPKVMILEGVPFLTFQRDGTLVFDVGTDVSTVTFKKDQPKDADLVIKQKGNQTWSFVDFRTTGQLRTKSEPMGIIPKAPSAAEDEES